MFQFFTLYTLICLFFQAGSNTGTQASPELLARLSASEAQVTALTEEKSQLQDRLTKSNEENLKLAQNIRVCHLFKKYFAKPKCLSSRLHLKLLVDTISSPLVKDMSQNYWFGFLPHWCAYLRSLLYLVLHKGMTKIVNMHLKWRKESNQSLRWSSVTTL